MNLVITLFTVHFQIRNILHKFLDMGFFHTYSAYMWELITHIINAVTEGSTRNSIIFIRR